MFAQENSSKRESNKIYVCRAKAEKAAAAEAAHIGTDMETNMEEAERFTLSTGVESRGPPDLALISRRIKETVRLLDTFKVQYCTVLAHSCQLLIVLSHAGAIAFAAVP